VIVAGAGLSKQTDPRAAAEEACARALGEASRADAALVLVSAEFEREQLPPLLDAVQAGLGTRAFCGASAHGVLAEGQEKEGGPGVAVLALSGLEAEPFLMTDLDPTRPQVGEELRARLGGDPKAEDLVVLLPDPRDVPLLGIMDELRESLGPAQVVGAGAADPVSSLPLQWCGEEVVSGALAGMLLRGTAPPTIGVTQACRPATEAFTVTRTRGHWILELDGRPALDVYREVARGPLADDLRRAASFVLLALPRDPDSSLDPGSYLVRNVAGFALAEKAFAIPDAVKPGDSLGIVVRDPQTARDDMKAMLEGLDLERAAAALYFDCCARGAGFFGVAGLEAAYLEQALGPVPVAGMFGSCEIGPIGGRPELLTYTGVLAVLRD
jgi:small ligand-binding sensory domain FIST